MSNDHKATAIEWAEVSEDPKTLAITHALLYLGEQLADQTVELSAISDSLPPASPEDDKKELVRSKLAATLAAPSPFTPETSSTNGHPVAENAEGADETELVTYRKFAAKHDPADWVKLEDGYWLSPGGRKYRPYSRAVIGVVLARQKRGLPV